MADSKNCPTLALQGKQIVIQMTSGPANSPVVSSIFTIVNNMDVTPAIDTKSGTTDASGDLTLTSVVLASGKYHVTSKISPPGQTPINCSSTITIPVAQVG